MTDKNYISKDEVNIKKEGKHNIITCKKCGGHILKVEARHELPDFYAHSPNQCVTNELLNTKKSIRK
jgi:hypothetical protein